jgi:hypothetical protein
MTVGGQRRPAALTYLAHRRAEELILKGYAPMQMLPILEEEGYTDSLATVRDWCQAVYAQWAAEDVTNRPHRRDIWRARLEARYAMMHADLHDPSMKMTGINRAKLYDSMAKLELLAIKLDGLDAPIRIEHSGAIDIRTMSPDQRRERIEELLERRKQAQLSPSVDGASN